MLSSTAEIADTKAFVALLSVFSLALFETSSSSSVMLFISGIVVVSSS
jgi:hypothetical protein